MKTYRRHRCTRRHRTFRTFAQCAWKWHDVEGEGAYAVVNDCRPKEVVLFAKEKQARKGQIRQTLVDLVAWRDALTPTVADAITIKEYDQLPLDFYFRVDDDLFVGPYLQGMSSQQTPSQWFSAGGSTFAFYSEYFERLWTDGSFCREVRLADNAAVHDSSNSPRQ